MLRFKNIETYTFLTMKKGYLSQEALIIKLEDALHEFDYFHFLRYFSWDHYGGKSLQIH